MATKVIITAETAQAQAAIRSFGQELTGLTGKFTSLTGIAGMLGGALSVATFAGIIKSSINLQDELTKLSSAYGINGREAAGLKFAADQNSTSLELVGKATKELMVNMAATPDKFARLGITAKDATGALAQVSDIVAQMPEGQQKVALLAELMGKKLGPEMSEFLSQGGDSLRKYIAKGQDIYKVTDEGARAAKEFKDQMAKLEAHLSGLGVTLTNLVLPNLTKISSAMADAARDGGILDAVMVGLAMTWNAMFTDDLLSRQQKITKQLNELRQAMDAPNVSKYGKNAISQRMIALQQELQHLQQKLKAPEEKPKAVPKPVEDLLAGNDAKLKDNFEAEEDLWRKKRKDEETRQRAGMQVLIGLEVDYQNELAKRAEAVRLPLLSASEKALAEDLRNVSKRAQDARVDLEKLHFSGTLSADQYSQMLQQVTADEEKQKESVAALRAQQDQLNASWQYGAKIALRTYLDEVQNTAKQSERLVSNAFRGMEDALVKFVRGGKLDFSSLADSIINDMIRIQLQQSVTAPLAQYLGGLFSGYSTTGGMAGMDPNTPVMAPANHEGGIAGREATFSKMVNPAVFAGAPRFHTGGITGDEVPIIARRGEGIFTPEQMRRLSPVSERPAVTVNITTPPGTSAQSQQRSDGNGDITMDVIIEQIEGGIARNVSRGQGALNGVLTQTFGLNRAAGVLR